MVTLKFYCTSNDGNNLEVVSNLKTNQIYIGIDDIDNNVLGNLCLDKQTAIKLSKELRKQIALLD
jgi:hypothetical protein